MVIISVHTGIPHHTSCCREEQMGYHQELPAHESSTHVDLVSSVTLGISRT